MGKKGTSGTGAAKQPAATSKGRPSALLDTRVVYCGDNLEQLAKLPDVRRPGVPHMNAGFLYVLINASMPDVVKVGKTERDPESRAKELSGVTGVPTAFVVVYQEFFDDCSAAEEYVHALLEQGGFRVATNREFFSAPTRVAIQAVVQAKAALGGRREGAQPLAVAGPASPQACPQSEPWEQILEQGRAASEGYGETLQDFDEAARLYEQAARLGSGEACYQLGVLHLNPEFAGADGRAALKWLKEGARRGYTDCYAELAEYFLENRHAENATKMWRKYREACAGHEESIFWWRCYNFLLKTADTKIEIGDFDWFEQHGEEVIRGRQEFLDSLSHFAGGYREIDEEANMCLVQYLLYPENPLSRRTGELVHWDENTNMGSVLGEGGQVAILYRRQIVEGKLLPTEGQSVEYVPVKSGEHQLACVARLL